jgi:uncharacterized protein (TIGR04255 family)
MPVTFPPLGPNPVSFSAPPVVEVAIAVQFAGAVDPDVLGAFRSRIRSTYPRREDHPAQAPMTEDFAVPPSPPSLMVQLGQLPPRHWFVTEDTSRLIQVQADRLGLNWRLVAATGSYPRYNALRDEFAGVLSELLDAQDEIGGTLPPINFVEVVYVNRLVYGPSESRTHPDLGELLTPVSAGRKGSFLPQAEDAQVRMRYRIDTGSVANAQGRLYVTAEPAFDPGTGEPLFLMVLTARLAIEGLAPQDSYLAIDLGREWIVRGFKDLTTSTMHEIWGLRDGPSEEEISGDY